MADINLTADPDDYTQLPSKKDEWNHIRGLGGNDIIRLYQGIAVGGPGNDRFEKIADPTNPGRQVHLAYWDAGANLLVNLAEGWADDGQGGRDTFTSDFRWVHGSGGANARVIGSGRDEYYWPNGGTDTFEGGGGNDGINLNSGSVQLSPGQSRPLVLEEMNIVVSADGRNATITQKTGGSWSITTVDVEYVDVWSSSTSNSDGTWISYRLADLITPQVMAQQTVAAGGNLRWNASANPGTAVAVTYSFVTTAPASGPGATGFRAFTEAERQLVRDILAKTAALTHLTFTEVVESGGNTGQMRFGASQQTNSKGVAWMPNQAGAGSNAGDVWMDLESMAGLAVGTEGYQALLHEIGHALGLRHPRNTDPGDAWPVQLVNVHDKQTMTVMSGTPTADGLFRSDWGPLDVLALRYLYGTRNTNSGDTVYTLGSSAGNFEQTLTDDGGTDTIDASALATGVQITLVPGGLSNVGFSSNGVVGVDNLAITATTQIEHAIGTAADDELIGNDADNRLTGGLGNDWLDGGKGTDTAVFAGPRSAYDVDHAFGLTYVRARDGVSGFDTLVSIERLQFADQTLTLGASPLSEDVSRSVDEDTPLTGTLPTPSDLSSRTGVTWSMLDAPAHGIASVAANGDFSYTPAANFWGSDSFGYRVSTANGANNYRVYVTVKPINDGVPVGSGVTLMVPAGTAFDGQVPAGTDADGDPLSYAVASEPSHGALDFSSDGRYTYTPATDWFGDDAFDFTVSDGAGGSNRYTVTLRVGLQTLEDTALATLLPLPLGATREATTYTLAAAPARGVLTISPQGNLGYAPAGNAHGVERFSYDVHFGSTTSRIQVDLRVASVNDGPPVAANASHTLVEDGRLEVNLPAATEPDGDPVVYALASAPRLGSASISAAGRLVYTPRPDANGSDSLTYTVADPAGLLNTYTVQLGVTAVNDAPLGADVQVSVQAGRALNGLLPTAGDVEGDALLYLLAASPAKGQVSLSLTGRYTYTPQAGASGSDSFAFTVNDSAGASSRHTVSITIVPAAGAAAADTEATVVLAAVAPQTFSPPPDAEPQPPAGPEADAIAGVDAEPLWLAGAAWGSYHEVPSLP